MPFFIEAQITLTTQLPSDGLILKDQLWNIIITNNTNNIAELKLQVDVIDILMGQPVINANTGKIILGKGMKLLSIKDLQPIIYNYLSSEFSGNYLPCGSYTFNYHLVQETTKGDVQVADEITKINIFPLSPPMLSMPIDKSVIETEYPQFAWMPPVPMQMFNPLLYDITVVAIGEGQSPKEAMEFNKPVYSNYNLQFPSEKMATSFEHLEPSKNYAWQVVARSGGNCTAISEVWQFKINAPSIVNLIIDQTPFIKMKKDNPDKGIAPNGILKASYINETTESMVIVQIMDLVSNEKIITQFKTMVTPGENLIQFDLNKLIKLEEGKVYKAQIINNRNERWLMLFEFHEYDESKKVNTKQQ
jgi:hypothetical protein